MKVEYYRQGAARKELVQAISDITCTNLNTIAIIVSYPFDCLTLPFCITF